MRNNNLEKDVGLCMFSYSLEKAGAHMIVYKAEETVKSDWSNHGKQDNLWYGDFFNECLHDAGK